MEIFSFSAEELAMWYLCTGVNFLERVGAKHCVRVSKSLPFSHLTWKQGVTL